MPKCSIIRFILFVALLIPGDACVKKYIPPAIQAAHKYLVVDGFINTATGGVTTITLSRSKNLIDSILNIPELGASVLLIDSTNGINYTLLDTAGTGKYSSTPLYLNQANRYAIFITTSNGIQYKSAFTSPKITPPIDSLTWQQSPITDGVTINVNTHDPMNSTHYYRWDFLETWQHNAPVMTYWVLDHGFVEPLSALPLEDPRQTFQCWTTAASSHLVVGNSVGLSQDVISLQPINFIPANDERITVRYSILVNQYAISQDAYNYWILVQKNSQNLGSLFDLTPSQLISNIQCITDPKQPVIGYISACTVEQRRLFIQNNQVDWIQQEPYNQCNTIVIPTDTSNFLIYNYPDTSYAPWHFVGSFPPALIVISKYCIDCRTSGGTNSKPIFW